MTIRAPVRAIASIAPGYVGLSTTTLSPRRQTGGVLHGLVGGVKQPGAAPFGQDPGRQRELDAERGMPHRLASGQQLPVRHFVDVHPGDGSRERDVRGLLGPEESPRQGLSRPVKRNLRQSSRRAVQVDQRHGSSCGSAKGVRSDPAAPPLSQPLTPR